MEQNPIVPDPARKVIAYLRGGAIELLDTSDDPAPKLCSVRICHEVGTTRLVGYTEGGSRQWPYCAEHGAEVLIWIEAKMPGMRL